MIDDLSEHEHLAIKKVTWRDVIRVFWNDQKYLGLRLYGVILLVTIFITWPSIIIQNSVLYGGARPPQAPLVRAEGSLRIRDEQNGFKTWHHYEFVTNTGKVFVVSERQLTTELLQLFRTNPSNLHVEGFFLRDGKGFFYITRVVDRGTSELLIGDKLQYELLERASNTRRSILLESPFYMFLVFIFAWKFFKIKSTLKGRT